jgi:tRNA threonylcarbamoyladenosine biosynthesis protein TsaB
MIVMAFDTCFDGCSACLGEERDGLLAELSFCFERFATGHAERLVPMIGEVMDAAQRDFSELDRIAVTTGPGTFTGTRIGIAAARALALVTEAETVGISSLAAMAAAAADQLPAGMPVLVAVDARRDELYVQPFAAGGLQALDAPLLLSTEQAASLLPADTFVVVGSGGAAVAEAARAVGRRAEHMLPSLLPDARAVARLAVNASPSAEPLAPLYLRPPDAKPQTDKALARIR